MKTFLVFLGVVLGVQSLTGQGSTNIPLPASFHGHEAIDTAASLYGVATSSDIRKKNLAVTNLATGKVSTAEILADLPGASEVQVWSAAASSQYFFVSVIAIYEDGPGRGDRFDNLILKYAPDASLKAIWNIEPLKCYKIAVDSQGQVYCYGPSSPPNDKSNFYALRKYSAEGKLIGKYLSDNNLSAMVQGRPRDIAESGAAIGVNAAGMCVIFLKGSATLIRVDTNSGAVTQTSLKKMLDRVELGQRPVSLVSFLAVNENTITIEAMTRPAKDTLREQLITFSMDASSIKSWKALPRYVKVMNVAGGNALFTSSDSPSDPQVLRSVPIGALPDIPLTDRAGIEVYVPL